MAAFRRRSATLCWIVFTASAACAMALPTHIDDMVHPDGWKYGVRIRAVQKPPSATLSKPLATKQHSDYYLVVAPGSEGGGVKSLRHSEGELGSKYQVAEETRIAPEKRAGAWQTHPDIDVVLPVVNDDAFRDSGNGGVKADQEKLKDKDEASGKTGVASEKGHGAWETHPDIEVVLPVVDEDSFRDGEDDNENTEKEKKPMEVMMVSTTEDVPVKEDTPMKEPVFSTEADDSGRKKRPDTEVVLPAFGEETFGADDSETERDEVREEEKEDLKDPLVPQVEDDKRTVDKVDNPSDSASSTTSDKVPQKDESIQETVPNEKSKDDIPDSTTQNVKVSETSPINVKPEDVKKPEPVATNNKDATSKVGPSQTAAKPSDAASPAKPPRREAPAEFRKNHAARPQVRPTPPRDFIAENPLYEWTFPCSNKEKSCLEEDRVLYEGDRQCYQLWRTGPCGPAEWLVIDKKEAVNGSGHFKATCSKMSRCPAREVYMASDRQCHPLSQIIREVCPKHEGLQLSYNVFGEGECKCDNCPAPQLPTNTFNEGRCAFPPSFYRASLEAELQVVLRATMAEAEAEAEADGESKIGHP